MAETVDTKVTSERSYEEAIERLTDIVQKLESGELSLEESLNLFEEGVGLARFCTGKLDAAEGRLDILLGIEKGEPKIGQFKPDPEES
jgi:exodeoxyribonuclease VII small subunit